MFGDKANLFYPDAEAEPLEKPTEEHLEETPAEDEEVETEVVSESDAEEAEQEDESESESEDTTEVYLINGKEYTQEDIERLESGNMMQAAFTRKTQALAEEKKDFRAKVEVFEGEKERLNDLTLQLEVLVAEDEEINLEELKEYDEVEYYKAKEKIERRKSKLAELKQAKPEANVLSQEDQQKLFNDFAGKYPEYVSEGKYTDKFNKDMKSVESYLKEVGYTQEDIANLVTVPQWNVVIDAALAKRDSKKRKEVKKEIKKSPPKVTKPKEAAKEKRSPTQVLYG